MQAPTAHGPQGVRLTGEGLLRSAEPDTITYPNLSLPLSFYSGIAVGWKKNESSWRSI
jgi:hypothetical protein